MGHFCRLCGCTKPNEAFSGKGHRIHVCKACARLPKEERDAIEQSDEIFRFLEQSHISARNVARLRLLAASPHPRTAELAGVVLEVAAVKPYKKRRLKFLSKDHRELLEKLEKVGLILAHSDDPAVDGGSDESGDDESDDIPWTGAADDYF